MNNANLIDPANDDCDMEDMSSVPVLKNGGEDEDEDEDADLMSNNRHMNYNKPKST